MKKTWLAGGFVLAAAAVGCGDANVTQPPGPGVGGEGGGITSTLCSDPNSGGRLDPSFGGTGAAGAGSFSPFPPNLGTTNITQNTPPPAISGGTLRVLADGKTAVAADPDRDRVYVVDLTARTVRATIGAPDIAPGDEPGRVVTDAAGRAHVALRRGGAILSIDTATGKVIGRRSVCAAPRGVAYDRGNDLLHVACSDGQLVSFPAAGGAAVRTVTLARDLRDVVVDGPHLRVSRFRSAELLTVEADGRMANPDHPIVFDAFRAQATRGGQLYTAGIAWKMEEMPDGSGVMVLHQRGVVDQVQPVVGGYGGPDACSGIVHPAVTAVNQDGKMKSGPALAGLTLAVDMAISPDGKRVAMVSAGNSTNTVQGMPVGTVGSELTKVFVTSVDAVTDETVGCMPDGNHAPCPAFGKGGILLQSEPTPPDGTGGAAGSSMAGTGSGGSTGSDTGVPPDSNNCVEPDPSVPQVVAMEPIAVAFDAASNVIIQSREPALLAFRDGRGGATKTITLSTESKFDTGHLIFHANAGGFLACASCHAEGNDDGRTWDFTCQGTRRTQSLQVGLKGTEPFHWAGDETNFGKLMQDVFQGRMSGPQLTNDQNDRLFSWIDAQPRPLRTAPTDATAVERGRTIFNSTQAACGTCHTAEKGFTNSMTVDVGTNGLFQVPSLVGIGTRGPFMHNGCAKTLTERFTNTACGGGDKHGVTSGLSEGQISDLVAFLNAI